MDFNLVDATTRPMILDEAVAASERLAFPLFHAFDDAPRLMITLVAQDVPGISRKDAVELLLCFGSRDGAEAYLGRVLTRCPEMRDIYARALGAMRRDGVPLWQFTSDGEALAAAVILYELAAPAV